MDEQLEKARLDPSAGYTIVHSPGDRLRDGYDVHITAHAPGADPQAAHSAVGLGNFFKAGGVGYLQLRYSGKTARSSTAYSHQVYVHPDHRHKGVASAMYAYAEKHLGIKMVPSKDRTKDGKALWAGNKQDPQFGKVMLPDGSGFFTGTVGKSESLAKAVDPKDMASIINASDPAGAALVDHVPHLTSHPAAIQPEVDAYRAHVLNSPEKVKKVRKAGSGISEGITKKVLYDVPVAGSVSGMQKRYLVKPYHERIVSRVSKWMQHPHQGWAEMANQALYHAGGIGNLHQHVHVSEHDFMDPKSVPEGYRPGVHNFNPKEPALVVHLAPEHVPAASASQALLPEGRHAARQIAIMDFLTNNLDRHGGNLLRHYSGKAPLAIDHSRSFQYVAPNDDQKWLAPSKRGRDVEDQFGGYHTRSSIDKLAPLLRQDDAAQSPLPAYGLDRNQFYDATRRSMEDYVPAFDWWGENSGKIRGEMDNQLQQIKDPEVIAHIKRNFDARADWLDERANIGIENYGDDWYRSNGVPMYRPGELTDEEKRDPRVMEAAQQKASEAYAAKLAERRGRRDYKKQHAAWMDERPGHDDPAWRAREPKPPGKV